MLRFLTGIFFAFCTIFGDITLAAVDASSAQVAHTIGDAKAAGLNKTVGQLAHAGAGALKEQLKGGDPLAGAIGAVVAETAAEAMDKPGATHEERQKIAQKARLIGDTVAFLAGRDVASADSAGATALENNFIAHPEASMKIAMAVRDESLSEEERSHKIEKALDYAKAENKVYLTTAAATLAPTITAGYFAPQSLARWTGTYAGGGMQAVTQEFKDHPILSTVDVVTTGMLGAGFVKSMAKVPQLVEAGQTMYKHHKAVGQLRSNVSQGKQFEREFEKQLQKNPDIKVIPQVTLEVENNVRIRPDFITVHSESGQIKIYECKSSLVAPLTKNQKIGFPEVEISGAFIVGQGQGVLKPGVKIPPTKVEIVRKTK